MTCLSLNISLNVSILYCSFNAEQGDTEYTCEKKYIHLKMHKGKLQGKIQGWRCFKKWKSCASLNIKTHQIQGFKHIQKLQVTVWLYSVKLINLNVYLKSDLCS